MSVPVVQASPQVPTVSPFLPHGYLQQTAVPNPVFIDSRLAAVHPTAVTPSSTVAAMPLLASCGMMPQHSANVSVMPHTAKLSPVIQPHCNTSSADNVPPADAHISPAVADS